MWPFRKGHASQSEAGKKRAPSIRECNDALQAVMAPWKEKFQRKTWLPKIAEGELDAAATSYFGGMPFLPNGEQWPLCGQCDKPAPFLLQLDSRQMPSGAPQFGEGLLQFFYCLGCPKDFWGRTMKPFGATQIIRIISFENSHVASCPDQVEPYPRRIISGWDRRNDLPEAGEDGELEIEYGKRGRVSIGNEALGIQLNHEWPYWHPDLLESIDEQIGGPMTGDKLGGWPYWVQGPEWIECPICNVRMRFVFQIDSECNLPIPFGDVGCGHIFQCVQHQEKMAFGWACH